VAEDLASVVYSEKLDGSWQAIHEHSLKTAHGLTREEAEKAMSELLGIQDDGTFDEPPTSDRFDGLARDIALYLEGPISEMLKLHSGYARLEAYQAGNVQVRLGGGCQGCPSSLITLSGGVKADLQHKFGEDIVADIIPVLD
jgi:Fe-S cluster biogenesis protein NfuA